MLQIDEKERLSVCWICGKINRSAEWRYFCSIKLIFEVILKSHPVSFLWTQYCVSSCELTSIRIKYSTDIFQFWSTHCQYLEINSVWVLLPILNMFRFFLIENKCHQRLHFCNTVKKSIHQLFIIGRFGVSCKSCRISLVVLGQTRQIQQRALGIYCI